MSLRPRPDLFVPDDTARVARAISPDGNLVMQVRDRLLDGDQAIFRDDDFADLFPQVGQPAAAPARLALVLVLQFMEALTDRQAADAVRRITARDVLKVRESVNQVRLLGAVLESEVDRRAEDADRHN